MKSLIYVIKMVFLGAALLAVHPSRAAAETRVVASIKPVHSLVAAVMRDVRMPGLIVEGSGSPHNYALKPSQAKMLEEADVVFWIGREMEAFLEKPLKTIGEKATSVSLMDTRDLIRRNLREGGAFDEHEHDDAKDADNHADGKQHDHDLKHMSDHDQKEHDGKEHEHAHGEFDAHVWLDPVNAKVMVKEITKVLAEADPENAEKYSANAKSTIQKLDTLVTEVKDELNPVRGKRFIVFHDAYQYFEERFGLLASGSITVSPEVAPGAERVVEIKKHLRKLEASCVFAEPQFEPKLVATVIEGTTARSGIIDPLGSEIESGPDLYFQIINNMASSFKTCLAEPG